MKVAKLVTITLTTRVVVDENISDEQIFEVARPELKRKAAEEMFENLEKIEDDTECPYPTLSHDKYYQPKIDDNGDIEGHSGENCFSFEVWSTKEKLIEDYPNCTPIEYSGDDIEEMSFVR